MTMIALDFRTYMRNPETLFFTIGLPLGLYLIFGVSQAFGDMPIGYGNVNAAILVNMSLYAALLAVVGFAGTAAVEKIQGWGRQLALTPLSDSTILRNRVLTAMLVCLAPLVVLLIVGHVMGAEASGGRLFVSFALIMVLSASFTLYGLAVAYLLRSETAVSVASGLLVVFGFAGNLFTPLSGALLEFARFTPLYGLGVISRYPVTGGVWSDQSGNLLDESLTFAIGSYVVWLVIFGLVALWALRRSRSR